MAATAALSPPAAISTTLSPVNKHAKESDDHKRHCAEGKQDLSVSILLRRALAVLHFGLPRAG